MESKSEFRWLASQLAPWRSRLAMGLLCISIAASAPVVDPLLMRYLIDDALPRHNLRLSLELTLGIGLCYLVHTFLFGFGSLINYSVSQGCVRNLRVALLDKLHQLSADYHEQTATGEKVTRIEHDVDEISNFGADAASQSFIGLMACLLDLAIMARLNFGLTLCILPLLPLFVVIQRHFKRQLRLRADEARAEVGTASSFITEHLSGVQQIQLLRAEKSVQRRAASYWEAMLDAMWAEKLTQTNFGYAIGVLFSVAVLTVLVSGSRKVLANTLTVGGLVAFYTYILRIFGPLNTTMALYARLQSVGASIRRVRNVLELEPTIKDAGTKEVYRSNLRHGIKVSDVFFSYGDNPVLDGIDLEIMAGERVAIIGTSGSGKSTLARLMLRVMDPCVGTITLEGCSLREYRLAALRETICYVPQQPALFRGSIRENLLYANASATDQEMYRAIKAAQFMPVLDKLPQGLDSLLGPGANSLSGGERQMLAVARALLANSPMLILDEATSALDARTEEGLLTALANFPKNQTLIIISHRLSSLTWVDRLLLLHNGRIAAAGDHDTLYGKSELYRSLFKAVTIDV